MEEVAGVMKLVDLNGIRYQALKAMAVYESARMDLEDQRRVWGEARSCLRWLDGRSNLDTVNSVAMRLGISTETLLEVLQDLRRSEGAEE
jgi:hypothetical protein